MARDQPRYVVQQLRRGDGARRTAALACHGTASTEQYVRQARTSVFSCVEVQN